MNGLHPEEPHCGSTPGGGDGGKRRKAGEKTMQKGTRKKIWRAMPQEAGTDGERRGRKPPEGRAHAKTEMSKRAAGPILSR